MLPLSCSRLCHQNAQPNRSQSRSLAIQRPFAPRPQSGAGEATKRFGIEHFILARTSPSAARLGWPLRQWSCRLPPRLHCKPVNVIGSPSDHVLVFLPVTNEKGGLAMSDAWEEREQD